MAKISLKVQLWYSHHGGNQQLSDLRPNQQEENHACYWKHSQLLRDSEAVDLRRKSALATLPDWHTFLTTFKISFFYQQISKATNTHQKKLLFTANGDLHREPQWAECGDQWMVGTPALVVTSVASVAWGASPGGDDWKNVRARIPEVCYEPICPIGHL